VTISGAKLSNLAVSAAICWHSNLENTIGHHQGGCQQHNISGALSRAVRKLRASFFVIVALVGCKGEAIVPLPDGWNIGARPIDLHVRGLEALGAQVEIR
jgi:UDP-N-acetylglucosamine enolpyruvyl transferase